MSPLNLILFNLLFRFLVFLESILLFGGKKTLSPDMARTAHLEMHLQLLAVLVPFFPSFQIFNKNPNMISQLLFSKLPTKITFFC